MRKLIKQVCVVWWENLFVYLLWMIGVIFIYLYVSASIASGADWEEEDMTWDEDKQEFVFTKKDSQDKPKKDKNKDEDGWTIGGKRNDTARPTTQREGSPPQHSWERYLPVTVRQGKRNATQWEINEAQRKYWAKAVITQRSAIKSQQRRNTIAYRKATGWYDQRRSGAHAFSGNGLVNQHMNAAMNVRFTNYNHSPGCASSRGLQYGVPAQQRYYIPKPPVYRYTPPAPTYTNQYAGNTEVRDNAYPNYKK